MADAETENERPPAFGLNTHEQGGLRRSAIASYLGQSFGGDRDIYDVAGYDKTLRSDQFWAKYVRQDIAKTIVDAPPKASWRKQPTITDDPDTEDEPSTPFDEAVEVLFDFYGLLRYWERVDRLAGLGDYAVLYLGVADDDEVGELSDDVDPSGFDELTSVDDPTEAGLAFLAPYSERRASDIDTVQDPRDPRFGLPETYTIEFDTDDSSFSEDVHFSRVIHVAEDVLEDEVRGVPRLKAVYNRLEDLEKVIGGSAEMFWRGAAPRWQAKTDEGTADFADRDEIREEIEALVHGMDIVAYLRNVDLEPIQQGVGMPDPSGVVDGLLQLIAGETGIPKRILTGSERGELASTQDRATFYERISERQEKFCEPGIVRPTIDRFIEFGFLPEPEDGAYEVIWPELFELNEVEAAEVMQMRTESLLNASPMKDPEALATVEEIREQFLDMPPERGEATSVEPVEDELPDDDLEDDEMRELLDRLRDGESIEDILGDVPDDGESPESDGPGAVL